MKKRLLSVALLMGAYGAYGQVGIGTLTPNASSQLDVVSNDKGILLPRVSLSSTTDSTTISNGNVNSLLVFNTNTENDIKPGYYYWFEDKWMRVMNEDDVTQFDHNTTNSSLTVINGNLVLFDSDGNEVSIPLSEINIPSTLIQNQDGTYTFTNELGETVIIDATDNVINNFENIVNNTNVLNELIEVLGDTYVGGNVNYDGDTFTYIDQTGNTQIVNIQDIVENTIVENIQNLGDIYNEIINLLEQESDTLVNNGDGTYTHTAVDSTSVIIDANTTTVTVTDGVYTFLNGNGDTITTIDTNADAIIYDNTDSELAAENVQDAIDELANLLEEGAGVELQDKGDGKITLVAENGDVLGTVEKAELTEDANNDGLFTFTRNDGVDVVFDVNSVNVTEKTDAAGNVVGYDFLDANGNPITTVYTDASNNYYDNTDSELVAENVQDAIDELADIIDTNKGDLTSTADNRINITNGTKALLHDAQIDVNEGNLRLQNIGGTLQVSQIQNGTSGQILVTNEGGNGVTWAEPLAIAKGDLTSNDLEVTNGTNSIIKDVSLEIKTGAITTDKIQNKAVTADKLNGGTGVDDRVGVADADGNITYTTLDEAVKNNETVTVLVKNTDGTYTYYNENEIAADGTPLATATGSKIDNAKGATAADDATLGLVKEATDNPTVAVSQTGELSVNLENVNAIKEVNNDYNAILDDVILLGNANTGDITITLPDAAGNKGKKFTIKKHDTNEDYFVNVVGNINGLTELYTALPHSGWDLVSDGLTWKIVNKF